MNFFTADLHFCDELSMKEDNRPFETVEEYDQFIINDWNKTAQQGDTIYVAGDMLDCNGPRSKEWKKGLALIKNVNADVVLIIGNNEQRVVDFFFDGNYDAFVTECKKAGIKEVYKRLDIEMRGKKFHIVHQIVHGDKRKINLFGHTHLCSGLYHPYGLCISTDLNHFRLFSENLIFGYLERKYNYWEPDDNTNYLNPFLSIKGRKVVNKTQKRKKYQRYLKNSNFKTKIK